MLEIASYFYCKIVYSPCETHTLAEVYKSAIPTQFRLTIFLIPFFMKPAVYQHEYVLM
jgi:hypothetical protein